MSHELAQQLLHDAAEQITVGTPPTPEMIRAGRRAQRRRRVAKAVGGLTGASPWKTLDGVEVLRTGIQMDLCRSMCGVAFSSIAVPAADLIVDRITRHRRDHLGAGLRPGDSRRLHHRP